MEQCKIKQGRLFVDQTCSVWVWHTCIYADKSSMWWCFMSDRHWPLCIRRVQKQREPAPWPDRATGCMSGRSIAPSHSVPCLTAELRQTIENARQYTEITSEWNCNDRTIITIISSTLKNEFHNNRDKVVWSTIAFDSIRWELVSSMVLQTITISALLQNWLNQILNHEI